MIKVQLQSTCIHSKKEFSFAMIKTYRFKYLHRLMMTFLSTPLLTHNHVISKYKRNKNKGKQINFFSKESSNKPKLFLDHYLGTMTKKILIKVVVKTKTLKCVLLCLCETFKRHELPLHHPGGHVTLLQS